MDAEVEEIIHSILNKKDTGNVFFVSLARDAQLALTEKLSDVDIIDIEKIYTPLQPFLQMLLDAPIKPTNGEIESLSYILQRDTFKTFLTRGVAAERLDMISYEEIFYEKIRYCATVVSLVKRFAHGNYIILNAQHLCEESISILKSLEKEELGCKIVFCFDFVDFEPSSNVVSEYFNSIMMSKNYFDVITLVKSSNAPTIIVDTDGNSNKIHLAEVSDFDTLFNAIHNARIFLDFDYGKSICACIEKNNSTLSFNAKQMRELNLEIGILCYYSHMLDEAALYLNYVMETTSDDETEVKALIYIVTVFLQKKMEQTAMKYSKLALQKLQNNKTSPYYALALMLGYIIDVKNKAVSSIDKYNETLAALEQNGFYNSYANVVLVIPWVFVNDKELREVIRPKIEAAFKIATRIDNQFCLSTVCHWKGILTSFDNKTDEALEWFTRCDSIRVKIGDISSIIKIRNGLSYEFLVRSQYEKSYSYINDFISQIDQIDDYAEIIITFKNMAHALVYGHSYRIAYIILKKMLQFIHIFGLENVSHDSFFPEYNDLLLYKTLIDLYNEDFVSAKISLHNITNNRRPITPVEKSILYLSEAILAVHDERIIESSKIFDYLMEYYRKVEQGQEHRVVFMHYEYALTLQKYSVGKKDASDYIDLANQYFDRAREIAKTRNLQYFLDFQNVNDYKSYLDTCPEFPAIKINLNNLAQRAENNRLVNQFHKKLHDYQFLNKIMMYGTDTTSPQDYIKLAVQSVFDYSMADSIFLAEKIDDKWKVAFSLSMSNIPAPDVDTWELFIATSKKANMGQLVYSKSRNFYFCNLSRFNYKGAIILVPERSNPISLDSLNMLNIALLSIQAQIVMFKQNEHLLYISSTDQLSLLKNRRALEDQIAVECDRLSRYHSGERTDYEDTIAFMDLDNFKYYNDTFGHEVGDLLISSFAKLLTDTFRKLDFIARFGGDEFVCILGETPCFQGKYIAKRLYEALERENHFIPAIEKYLGHSIEVPDNRYLSFSMGLSSTKDVDGGCDLQRVLVNADKALYFSKQHGKSQVSIWSEVKDKVTSDITSRFEKK